MGVYIAIVDVMSEVSAYPFLIQSFGSPTAVAVVGEYCAVANSKGEVFVTRRQKVCAALTEKAKLSAPLTKISLKVLAHPMLIGVYGSSEVVLLRSGEFHVVKLPCFLLVKSVAVVSVNLAIVCDSNVAMFWDMAKNTCSLCFASQSEILDVYASSTRTLILTADSVNVISPDGTRTTVSANLNGCFIRANSLMNRFVAVGEKVAFLISVDDNNEVVCTNFPVPDGCCDMCAVGNNVVGLFDTRNHRKVLRVRSGGTWGNDVEVPGIDLLYGGPCFTLCFSAQFVLIIHQFPELFDPFASSLPSFQDVIQAFKAKNPYEVGNVLLMFYGLEWMVAAVATGNKDCELIVDFVLDELWKRSDFKEWLNMAKKWSKHVQNEHSAQRIVELLKSKDTNLDRSSLCPFAAILQSTGHLDEAFDLYLRAKDGKHVADLLPSVIEHVQTELPELIDLCLDLVMKNNSELASSILGTLSKNSRIIEPRTVLPYLMFSWELVDLYYQSFEELPTIVANAYVNALAIYQRSELLSYLRLSTDYDIAAASELLLKLGCIDEYEYLLSISNTSKYLELLVIREKWETLFKYLSIHKRQWPQVLKMMAFDSEYFVVFMQHLDTLGLKLSDIIPEIRKDCSPHILAPGFMDLANRTVARNCAETLVEAVCSDDAFAMFDQLIKSKTDGTVIEL